MDNKTKICVCKNDFIYTYHYDKDELLFIKGKEYEFEYESEEYDHVFVYYDKNNPDYFMRGVRFYIKSQLIGTTKCKYFYDYFEDIRLSKLKKIQSIYG